MKKAPLLRRRRFFLLHLRRRLRRTPPTPPFAADARYALSVCPSAAERAVQPPKTPSPPRFSPFPSLYQGKPSFSPERLSVVFSVREYSGKKKKKASSFRRAERKGRLIKKAEGRGPPPVTLMLQITPSCRRIPNSEAAPDPALQKEPLPQTTRSCSCPAYRNPWRTGPHGFSGRWPRLPEPWPEVRYFP